ncbi:MAG: hypothetical protein ACREPN_00680 [Rudaea sp.]
MNTPTEKSFLVFSGGNDRAVLGFLRALRLCGERASIVARTRNDKILRTRFRADVNWIRDSHDLTLDIFKQCLQHVREAVGQRGLLVLPSTEYFNTFLLQNRSEIERMGCEIPLVDASIYNLLTGKRTATDFFGTADIAVPRELSASTDLQPPLVAKPLHNVSDAGRSLYPQLLETHSQVAAFRASNDIGEYFFQEYVRGENLYLLFFLARDGKCDLIWSQRNILQQPNGKSMLLAERADFHRSTTAARMVEGLRAVGFWGLGMIEVIRTARGDIFIEMNPRIWGPVQFCLDQNQPLLQAFIGQTLYGDALRFIGTLPDGNPPRRNKYFWFGGLAATLAARGKPVWHTARRSLFKIVLGTLLDDVFLRMDSWRCFFYESISALKLAWHRERPEN